MATRKNSNIPTRPNNPPTDPQLDAAVQEAGQHPERALALAKHLDVGLRLHRPILELLTEAKTRDIDLDLPTLDLWLEQWSGGEADEFNQIGRLQCLIASSKEIGLLQSSLLDSMADAGYKAAESGDRGESEAVLRADLDLIAAQLIRVGYLAALDTLLKAFPAVQGEDTADRSPLTDDDPMNYNPLWRSDPNPDSLQAMALERVLQLTGENALAGDAACAHILALAEAPAYGALLEKYSGEPTEPDPGFDKAALAAHCFAAGILARDMAFLEPGRDAMSLMIGDQTSELLLGALTDQQRDER